MGRFALPEEVAEAVVFLIRNDYITGQVLRIDGGRNI
jgi:3-oxoacyl-[acyl-carrier protein] reductase